MRTKKLCACLVLLAALPWAAADEARKTEARADHAAFSKLIHQIVVGQLPKVYEDSSGWGQTTPIPDRLRLPRLQRTVVKVGDHLELPQGLWRKVRVWLDDPARDLQIRVLELRAAESEDATYHLTVAADALLRVETEVEQWQKGLLLVGFTAQADADLGLTVECDVAIALDPAKLPPEVKVEPKVTDLKTDLKDFSLGRVTFRRLGPLLEGEKARELSNEFKGSLRDLLRSAEPAIKEQANKAIVHGLREGKGTLSAEALLKAATPAPKAKDGTADPGGRP